MSKLTFMMFIMCFLISGCVSFTRGEQSKMNELYSYGIDQNDNPVKNPGVAGALNVLPGVGNFYLAAGTPETDQWIFGAFNLFLWPTSIFWGVPQAAIDADTINKKETIYYFMNDPVGREEYSRLKRQIFQQNVRSPR